MCTLPHGGTVPPCLAAGPVPSVQLLADARERGISRSVLYRARQRLTDRVRVRKTGLGLPWVWELIEPPTT